MLQDTETLPTAAIDFRDLFSELGHGYCLSRMVFDAAGKPVDYITLDVNRSFEEMLGAPKEAVVGKPARLLLPPDEHAKWVEVFGNVTVTGIPAHYEIPSPKNRKTFRGYAYSVSSDCFSVIFQDITVSKLAEEALWESANQYRTIVENMNDALFIHDTDGTILDCNDNACSLLGYGRDELVGANIHKIDTPEAGRNIWQHIESIMGTGKAVFDSEQMRKDGSRIFVNVSARVVSKEGKGTIMSFVRDITERKKAEVAMRESEEKYRLLVENTRDIIFSVTPQGVLNYISPQVRVIGYEPSEVMGRNFLEFVHEDDRGRVKKELAATLASGRETPTEIRIAAKDGQIKWVEESGRIQRDMSGTITGFSGILRDIAERKKAEEDQIKTEKLEALGHLAGGIAHDFNNIMATVFGYVQMAREQMTARHPARAAEFLDKAFLAYERARGLTKQFVTFARGGAPVMKQGDLGALISASVPFALTGSNVQAKLSIEKELWPGDFDDHQIGQVVDNIVINAKQAMENGGTLDVSARNVALASGEMPPLAPGRYVELRFRDSGPGIPPELHRKVFDPFFTTKKSGSGLGLATTWSIVKKHNGHIGLVSEPGKGATFIICLPASAGDVPAQPPAAKTKDVPDSLRKGKGRVLVMDDENGLRAFMVSMLKSLGYRAQGAKSGEDAIEKCRRALRRKDPFDAAILDLTVPGDMGGKGAAPKILAVSPRIRLIVASGYSKDPVMANHREYGFCGRIEKPFRKEDLRRAMDEAMAG